MQCHRSEAGPANGRFSHASVKGTARWVTALHLTPSQTLPSILMGQWQRQKGEREWEKDGVMKKRVTWQHPICHPVSLEIKLCTCYTYNAVKNISLSVRPHELRRIFSFPTPLAPLVNPSFLPLEWEGNHDQITPHSWRCPGPCPPEDYSQCFQHTKQDLVSEALGKYPLVTSLRRCQPENKGCKCC